METYRGWQNRKLMNIGTKEGEGSPNAWKIVWGEDLKCCKQLDQEKNPCNNCQNFQHLGWIESHQVYFLNYPECGNYLEISTRALDVSQQGFYQIRSWIFLQLKPTPPHFCFSLIGISALLSGAERPKDIPECLQLRTKQWNSYKVHQRALLPVSVLIRDLQRALEIPGHP